MKPRIISQLSRIGFAWLLAGMMGLGLLESKRRMDDMRVYDIFFTPRGRLVLRNVIRALTGKPIAPMPKKED